MTKVFLNLTNGLLYTGAFDGFIRIQSCHCERKCWGKVIENIDNNFLMWLALGKDIVVVDYSARKQVPRALYQGLHWIWYAVQKSWGLPLDKAMVRGNDCSSYFEGQWKLLDKKEVNKLKYFRKFLNNPKFPQIISGQTNFDGDYELLSNLAKAL